MGVFAKDINDPKFRDSEDEVITLDDLEKALTKIDYFADRQLDRLEFLLLALDRSLVFQKEYLLQLYQIWLEDPEHYGEVRVRTHLHRLLENPDTTEQEDA